MHIIPRIDAFDWNQGNRDKNSSKHGVSNSECEEVFFNHPLLVSPDIKHSQVEKRFHALGHTQEGRMFFLTFTIRQNSIRVISARDMNKKEKSSYEKAQENSQI